MQKLRSMTETIKMLSDENSNLRGENDQLRDVVEEAEGVTTKGRRETTSSCDQNKNGEKATEQPSRQRNRKLLIISSSCHY